MMFRIVGSLAPSARPQQPKIWLGIIVQAGPEPTFGSLEIQPADIPKAAICCTERRNFQPVSGLLKIVVAPLFIERFRRW